MQLFLQLLQILMSYFNLPFRNRAVYSTALSQFNIYANVQ